MTGPCRAATATLVLLLSAAPGTARAHHPSVGFGSGTAGPILTIPATPLPKGAWGLGIRADVAKFDTFSDDELTSLAAAGDEVHSIDDQWSLFFAANRGVTDDLTLGVHIPYIVRRGIREGHEDDGGVPEVHVHGDSEGIGDLSLLGQYRFLRAQEAGVDAALLFGLKAPTGRTRETDRDGERFAAEFQPGSGSWDYLVGAAASRRWDSASLDASLLYTLATKGAQETDLGDTFHYGAALSWRWTPSHHAGHEAAEQGHGPETPRHGHVALDFVLEAAGETQGRMTVAGTPDPNSGGTLILISPGVRVDAYERWTGYLSFGIPVLQRLNGVQHETGYRVVLGLGAGF